MRVINVIKLCSNTEKTAVHIEYVTKLCYTSLETRYQAPPSTVQYAARPITFHVSWPNV